MTTPLRRCWGKCVSRSGIALCAITVIGAAHGQTSVITSFQANGLLTGTWSNTLEHLTNMPPVDGTMTTNVPMFSTNVPIFYRVVATLIPPPPGDTFDTAIPVVSGTFTGQTTIGFSNDYDASDYDTPSRGPDVVYSISIPPAKLLFVRVTPSPAFDTVIYLVAAPASEPWSCLAAMDTGDMGQKEEINYLNITTHAVAVYIVVDGRRSIDAGTFDLAVSLIP